MLKFELEEKDIVIDQLVKNIAGKITKISELEKEVKSERILKESYSKTLESQNGYISEYKKELDFKTKEIQELKTGIVIGNPGNSENENLVNKINELTDSLSTCKIDHEKEIEEKDLKISNMEIMNDKQVSIIKDLRLKLKNSTPNTKDVVKSSSPESEGTLNENETAVEKEFRLSRGQIKNKDL